jgi:CBS-domain-containing membrane protein
VIFDSRNHPETHWVAASLATAIAIVAMQFTKTTHPPAGATALIPIVDEAVNRIGWYYLPVVLLSSTMVLVTALLLNNIQRRYPTFWWTARPIVAPSKQAEGGAAVETPAEEKDLERGMESSPSSVTDGQPEDEHARSTG